MKNVLKILIIAGIFLSLFTLVSCSYRGSGVLTFTLRVLNRTDQIPGGAITIYVFKSSGVEKTLLGSIEFTSANPANYKDFSNLRTGDIIEVYKTENHLDLISQKTVTTNEDWYVGL